MGLFQIEQSETLRASQSLIYLITLPMTGLSVMLKTRCVGSPCRIYISSKGKPTFLSSEDSFAVEESSNSSQEAPFTLYPDVQSTTFNIGVRSIRENVSSLEETKFSMVMFTTGCYFWEEKSSKWKTDGCQVFDSAT